MMLGYHSVRSWNSGRKSFGTSVNRGDIHDWQTTASPIETELDWSVRTPGMRFALVPDIAVIASVAIAGILDDI